jgi:potassium-transporting ATPase KdpC subunit
MKTQTIIALKYLLVMTILTGIVYPLLMTGFAQLFYPSKANGSLIIKDGKTIGSELIGQGFDSSIYFWSRPSAVGYNTLPSGSSNLGPTSNTLKKQVAERLEFFARKNSVDSLINIPKEMIFTSGSGLDPHISPAGAFLQVDRISKARHFDNYHEEQMIKKIIDLTERPQYFFLGEERINVLMLNIELDKLNKSNSVNK